MYEKLNGANKLLRAKKVWSNIEINSNSVCMCAHIDWPTNIDLVALCLSNDAILVQAADFKVKCVYGSIYVWQNVCSIYIYILYLIVLPFLPSLD